MGFSLLGVSASSVSVGMPEGSNMPWASTETKGAETKDVETKGSEAEKANRESNRGKYLGEFWFVSLSFKVFYCIFGVYIFLNGRLLNACTVFENRDFCLFFSQ